MPFNLLFNSMDDAHEKLFWNFGLIIFFSIINFIISQINPKAFSSEKKFTIIDAIYFSTITHFTIGYGDYYPTNELTKILTLLHVIMAWLVSFVDIELIKSFTGNIDII